MKTNYRYIDAGVLGVVMLFLFLPLFQNIFHIKKNIEPLKGAYVPEKDTAFSFGGWFDGGYQEQKSKFLGQNFGLRNYCVRLNNQVDFTLFKRINTEHVLAGKAGVFFEEDYVRAYYGRNFVGDEKLKQLCSKLKEAQEILKSKGIILEVIFAPGKASFFPEYIPDEYRSVKRTSNYESLSDQARKSGLDHIDFNAWFKKLKPQSLYDLYPSGGIHWSNYGALLAFDSLRKHVERRAGLTLREFKITSVNFSDQLQNPDNDIGDALNLWRDIKPLSMPYAQYKWLERTGEVKPKALFVGDSYFWNWYYQGLVNNLFSGAQFWYYNQTAFPDTLAVRDVSKLPFKENVAQFKVIVLMATESNIHDIGWGFADKVIANFKRNEMAVMSDTLSKSMALRKAIYMRYLTDEIAKNQEWLEEVKKKAAEKNISSTEMIGMDADYLYQTKYALKAAVAYTEQTKQRMKKDARRMKQISAKAREKNVSVEEMMELDAKYLYDLEGKK